MIEGPEAPDATVRLSRRKGAGLYLDRGPAIKQTGLSVAL